MAFSEVTSYLNNARKQCETNQVALLNFIIRAFASGHKNYQAIQSNPIHYYEYDSHPPDPTRPEKQVRELQAQNINSVYISIFRPNEGDASLNCYWNKMINTLAIFRFTATEGNKLGHSLAHYTLLLHFFRHPDSLFLD